MKNDGLTSDGFIVNPVSRCSPEQVAQLQQYVNLLLDVNIRINLISRKETADVFDRHIRHSLILAARVFPDGCTIVDWGTGGGLPAIPLAIRFPHVNVVAVDSIGKKTKAVTEMATALGLTNLSVWNGRAEQWNGKAHYSVSRATARLDKLWGWHKRIRVPLDVRDGCWSPGLLCLKGGDLAEEIAALTVREKKVNVSERNLADIEPCFPDKSLVHVVKL